MIDVVFKFKPLLGLDESQREFHQKMKDIEPFYYCDDRTWACVQPGKKIEEIAKEVSGVFPDIVFIGFGQYQANGCDIGCSFRFIFNSQDIRLYDTHLCITGRYDFCVETQDNCFPDISSFDRHKIKPDPTWVVREWCEEDGFNECTKRFNEANSSYCF